MKKSENKKINLESIELENELLGCYLDDPDQCRADEDGIKLTEILEREENITDQANKIFDEFNFLGEEKKIYDFYELIGRYAENYEERENKEQPLGFPKLNAHINEVKGGQLAVVAAGTGIWKTTFALNFWPCRAEKPAL